MSIIEITPIAYCPNFGKSYGKFGHYHWEIRALAMGKFGQKQ